VGGEGGGGVGGEGGGGGRGEKWPKPCMHIWIIKEKEKKRKDAYGTKDQWPGNQSPRRVTWGSEGPWQQDSPPRCLLLGLFPWTSLRRVSKTQKLHFNLHQPDRPRCTFFQDFTEIYIYSLGPSPALRVHLQLQLSGPGRSFVADSCSYPMETRALQIADLCLSILTKVGVWE
jgi:hypothetical protein